MARSGRRHLEHWMKYRIENDSRDLVLGKQVSTTREANSQRAGLACNGNRSPDLVGSLVKIAFVISLFLF